MTPTDYSVSNSNNNIYRYANNNSILQKSASNSPTATAPSNAFMEMDLATSEGNTSSTSVTASSPLPALDSSVNVNEDSTECDAFLIGSGGSSRNSGSASGSRRTNRQSSSLYRGKMRNSCWVRAHSFVTRNWYLGCLVPASILGALLFVGWMARDYAKQLLFWIETQNAWLIFAVFMALFTVVSFPIVVGYFVLLITAGYLFGCLRGWCTVILGANLGIAIAHATIRSCRHRIPVQKLIKNDTGRAILRVISGPRAFRVVLFTRLTPIPFGLQNVIFGISSINTRDYHVATFLGLLPAQTINVYLGSTLRSMHEVLNDNDTKLTGYISCVVEVICGVILMFWVVQKARKELSETLLTADYSSSSNEGKHPDIQV
ncbi:transmembrane protein 64 [Drosophila miranda]|uniref:transmembrane protein 64 n=1 Tax=Drosophila miranda TaxID=7229 RepID=UPI0007E8B1F5|nr:transmembrane protein 64 [Drosophila miranda]